jgi:Calcium/calmodulin dependent protein kinase II association domain
VWSLVQCIIYVCSCCVQEAGGSAAVVSYVRLTQVAVNNNDGGPTQPTETRACEETRVWERNASTGMLLNVHFHRSDRNSSS